MRVRPVPLLLSLAGAAAGTYAFGVHPRIVRWGATDEEQRSFLAGDDLVATPRVRTTRAVDVDASPFDVWAWLIQIGQDRAGLYSYTALENLLGLRFHNADHLDPAWELDEGDLVRFVPAEKGDFGLTVLHKDPPHVLVLGTPGAPEQAWEAGLPFASWAFVVRGRGTGSRLVSRFRSDFPPSVANVVGNQLLLDPLFFLMERRMLLGIKERAERTTRSRAVHAVDELEAVPDFHTAAGR